MWCEIKLFIAVLVPLRNSWSAERKRSEYCNTLINGHRRYRKTKKWLSVKEVNQIDKELMRIMSMA